MHLYDDTIFAYATGRISAIETRLLTSAKLDALDKSDSKEECLKILSDAGYDASDIYNENDFDKMLIKEKDKLYALIHELSGDIGIADIFLLKNDYHNLKVLIKQDFLKNPVLDIQRLFIENGCFHIDKLRHLYANKDFNQFSNIMKDAVISAISHMQAYKSPQDVDIILDNALYSEMKSKSIDMNNDFLINLVSVMADLVNIKTFMRVKKLGKDKDFLEKVLVAGGDIEKISFERLFMGSSEGFFEMLDRTKYQSIASEKNMSIPYIEKKCDDFLIEYISLARFFSMGTAPIVAYLLKKENEINSVKIIMFGKEKSIWKSA